MSVGAELAESRRSVLTGGAAHRQQLTLEQVEELENLLGRKTSAAEELRSPQHPVFQIGTLTIRVTCERLH